MSKQTDLWMPVYIGDYLADTMHLTTEQSGAYFHLLMHYWRSGPPPVDDAVLCSITRLKLARFRKHKTTLLSFFTIAGGELRHKRADAEKAKAKQHADRRSDKAAAAAHARWHGSAADAPSNAPGTAHSNAPECPIPSHSVSIETAAPAAVDQKKLVFDKGLSLLMVSGVPEGSARSFLGRCRRNVGDQRLASLIDEAERRNICEPKAWLLTACANSANDQGEGLSAAITSLAARKSAQQAA